MATPIIDIKTINKSFHVGNNDIPVLKNISLSIFQSDFMIIFGPSGCGKSTLLHTILGLEEPNAGKIFFMQKDYYSLQEDERSDIRKKNIGMVYQQPNWIKSLTVLENVAFPLQLLGKTKNESLDIARTQLKKVEMIEFSNYFPTELSSGQQQRVALGRAMVTDPTIIIADEPTGNLDYESGQYLMKLLQQLNTELGKTILMVTHDLEYLKYAKTVIKLFNGEVVGIFKDGEKEKLSKEIKGKEKRG